MRLAGLGLGLGLGQAETREQLFDRVDREALIASRVALGETREQVLRSLQLAAVQAKLDAGMATSFELLDAARGPIRYGGSYGYDPGGGVWAPERTAGAVTAGASARYPTGWVAVERYLAGDTWWVRYLPPQEATAARGGVSASLWVALAAGSAVALFLFLRRRS